MRWFCGNDLRTRQAKVNAWRCSPEALAYLATLIRAQRTLCDVATVWSFEVIETLNRINGKNAANTQHQMGSGFISVVPQTNSIQFMVVLEVSLIRTMNTLLARIIFEIEKKKKNK